MNTEYIRNLLNTYNNRNIYDIETAVLIYEYFDKQEKEINDIEIEKVYNFIRSQDDIFDEYVKENILKIETQVRVQQEEKEAKEKIPYWIEKGKNLIRLEKLDEWKKCVETRASDLYHGLDLDAALSIIEKLNNGATLDEAKKLLDSQEHSNLSYEMVRNIVSNFSNRGLEFMEYTSKNNISNANSISLEELEREDI